MTGTTQETNSSAGILRLGNGFCDAKALLTAVELGLFTTLHETGPLTEERIRNRLGLHGRGLADFLALLVALGLLHRTDDGGYGNATGADRYLVRGGASYVGGFLERANRNLYPAYGRLGDALRTGEQQSGSTFHAVTENPAVLRQFVAMMDALTQVLGPVLVDSFDWSGAKTVLDVGGARGSLAGQIVKAQPHLAATVFDLPQMEPLFDEHAAEIGLTDWMSFHGGDFFADELPSADVVVFGHVLHDWDREQRAGLIAAAYRAVTPGGALLVYDRMLDEGRHYVENLVTSLNMLLVTDGGSEYPSAEVVEHAKAAGFGSCTRAPLSDFDTLVVCRKES